MMLRFFGNANDSQVFAPDCLLARFLCMGGIAAIRQR